MSVTPKVRERSWLAYYHEMVTSSAGKKSTPRRRLFPDNPASPSFSCEDDDAPFTERWSVESAKMTPTQLQSFGFRRDADEGLMSMRFASSDANRNLCVLPTPELIRKKN